MPRPWRMSEQAILIGEIRRARAASEIVIPGRTPCAILRKASRLRLVGDGIVRRPWSEANRGTLRKLRADGWTVPQMCAGPLAAYTPTAVRKQIQRLGLANPVYADIQRRAQRLVGPVLDVFLAFLTAHARSCTPEQIALAWNEDHEPRVGHGRVLYHLGQLGLRLPRRNVLFMAYSKIKRMRSQERSLAALVAYSRSMPEQNERALRERAEAARHDPAIPWQPCSECGELWPRQPEFFALQRKTNGAGPAREYLLRRCKLCRNRSRRSSSGGCRALKSDAA